MGRRGPPPTPTRILELRGSKRAAARADEPQPEAVAAVPPPPRHLDAAGKRLWRETAAELHGLGLLVGIDLAALEGYCVAYSRALAADRVIKREGMTLSTPQGFSQARPEVTISRQCWQLVRQFAGEFGLTPSARTRVRGPGKPEKPTASPFAEFAHPRPRSGGAGA